MFTQSISICGEAQAKSSSGVYIEVHEQRDELATKPQIEKQRVMRIAAGVSYNGAHYHGWQRQTYTPATLQTQIEIALSQVADHPITTRCAGRTDAGVHALNQIIHFDSTAERDERAWLLGANSYLPKDIRLNWVRKVPDDFHARFSATARSYRYIIYNHIVQSALLPKQTTWCCLPLNENHMAEAAMYLVGQHDFTSFRAQECQAKSPIRTVYQLDVQRQGKFIVIDIKANAFLHHMVRNIVGVLMAIGSDKQGSLWMQHVLQARDRMQAGVTAPAAGLYFVTADYPVEYALPPATTQEFLLS